MGLRDKLMSYDPGLTCLLLFIGFDSLFPPVISKSGFRSRRKKVDYVDLYLQMISAAAQLEKCLRVNCPRKCREL